MKKSLITLTTIMILSASMSISTFAMTAEEVTAKTPTSYTAGTNSIYGPSLNQDQLNAVAQATANFQSTYITDNMDNDQKIKAAHDFLKNNVSYIDWNKGEGANTAYGALAKGQAACSGYARAFKALCDSMDVSCYYIHADATAGNPSHQWNMVEYNDGYYFIDVEANDSSGFNAIYHSSTHPYTCDMSQLPAIGSKSGADTAGTQTVNNGWKEENGKWFYYENGNKAENKWIDGLYYVGSDGAMLVNTTTPDGYQVGSDGAWIQQSVNSTTPNSKTGRASNPNEPLDITVGKADPNSTVEIHNVIQSNGVSVVQLDKDEFTFSISSKLNNINPIGHEIWVVGYTFYNGIPFAIGEPKTYAFEYDKVYSLDYTGKYPDPNSFYNYCKNENLMIGITVVDTEDMTSGHNAKVVYVMYK